MQFELYCHAQMNVTVVSLICTISSQNIQIDQHASELKTARESMGRWRSWGLLIKNETVFGRHTIGSDTTHRKLLRETDLTAHKKTHIGICKAVKIAINQMNVMCEDECKNCANCDKVKRCMGFQIKGPMLQNDTQQQGKSFGRLKRERDRK